MNLLTLREVAETLKVSESTVRRLVRASSLAAYKIGKRGQLRVRKEDLEVFLEKQRVGLKGIGGDQEVSNEAVD
jgi:excisionase family DNA binding protein